MYINKSKIVKASLIVVIVAALLGTSSLLKKDAEGGPVMGSIGGVLILKTVAGSGIVKGIVGATGGAFILEKWMLPNIPIPTDNSWVVVASSEKDAFQRASDAKDIADFLTDIYEEIHDFIYGEENKTVKVKRFLGNSSHTVEIPLGSKVWQTDTASETTKRNYEGWYITIIGERSCSRRIGPIPWDVKSVEIVGE